MFNLILWLIVNFSAISLVNLENYHLEYTVLVFTLASSLRLSKSYTNFRSFVALNVYLALCYYKLDYYDVSLEVLQVYLQQFADSATAVNLRACNHYKLYNGKAAEVSPFYHRYQTFATNILLLERTENTRRTDYSAIRFRSRSYSA